MDLCFCFLSFMHLVFLRMSLVHRIIHVWPGFVCFWWKWKTSDTSHIWTFSALLILFPLLRMALSRFQTEKERDQREEWKIKWGERRGCGEQWSRKGWRAFHRISPPAWMSWWKPASKPLVSSHICFLLLLCKHSDQPVATTLACSTVCICVCFLIFFKPLQCFSC